MNRGEGVWDKGFLLFWRLGLVDAIIVGWMEMFV